MTQLKHDLNILNKLQTLGTIMMRISKRCWKNWYCRTRGKLEVKTEVIRSAINYLHYFWFRLPAPASGDDGQTHWCWRCSPWWHWCYDAVLYDEMAMLATWLWLLFYWWSLLLIKGLLAVGRIVKGCFFIPLGGERWSWWRRCRRRGPRRCGGAEVGSRTSGQLPVFIIGTWWVIRNLSKVPKMIPPSLQWGWRDEERNLSQDWRQSPHLNQSWRFTSF